jgi:hypothetical protein
MISARFSLPMMKFKFIWEDDTGKKPNRQERLKQVYLDKFYNPTDERDIQDRFIYEHVEDFFDLFERRYLQKILKDISYILDKKWASAIWEQDFYHGHICGKSKIAITDLDALLSPSNICFLYHTYEQQTWIPEAINRNIISYPNEDPKVVHPTYEFGTFPGYGVGSEKLGLMEYARFFFKQGSGPYTLKDGTKIDLWGTFH